MVKTITYILIVFFQPNNNGVDMIMDPGYKTYYECYRAATLLKEASPERNIKVSCVRQQNT